MSFGVVFPVHPSKTMIAHAKFYDEHKREVDAYDKDFIKKYRGPQGYLDHRE